MIQTCCSAKQVLDDSDFQGSESMLETCAFLPCRKSRKFALAMINLHNAEMFLAQSVR